MNISRLLESICVCVLGYLHVLWGGGGGMLLSYDPWINPTGKFDVGMTR